ncbi:MAG: DUF4214 domain-containing protein [Burkholderiaceae bacterium]|nr:DUF4214 domain-containing protein [Burkholderiaceae bacterium]
MNGLGLFKGMLPRIKKEHGFALLCALGLLTACGANTGQSNSIAGETKQLHRSTKTQASDYQALVQQLYVSYFGRPADPTGMGNFELQLQQNGAPTDIQSLTAAYGSNPAIKSLIDSFGTSNESQTLYGSGNTAAFVTAIFQNVLGRAPQSAGLTYWSTQIDSGSLTRGNAALAIMAGALVNSTAQGQADAALIKNRIGTATYFTSTLVAKNDTPAYAGAAAAASARQMLAAVTASTDPVAYQTTVTSTVTTLAATAAANAPANADEVTGLPADITSLLSLAGMWQPVDQQYINANFDGTIASSFHGTFAGTNGDNVVMTGWAYNGFSNNATSITPVNIAILAQQPDGTLKLATNSLVASAQTNGGGSVVVADFNGDGKPDIFLAAHNESPFIASPSTVLLSNSSGTFDKVVLNDKVMAHDAELAVMNGTPTVVTRTFNPGDGSPFYQYANGAFNEFFPANLGSPYGSNPPTNGMSIASAAFGGSGNYGVAIGDITYGPGIPYAQSNPFEIAVYSWSNNEIGTQPVQIIPGYFNARPQYASFSSTWGAGNTHTYRLWVDDFNHDGLPDLIGGASLWTQAQATFPATLQMLQNQGGMKFADVSDTLTPKLGIVGQEFEYTMQVRDVDGSGINSYLSAYNAPQDCSQTGCPAVNSAHTNYLLVNDGTGMLHVALHDSFTAWGDQVWQYLRNTLDSSYLIGAQEQPTPKFYGYLTANGKLNYVVFVRVEAQVNGTKTQRWALVNLPLQLDLKTQYKTPMVVKNRNGSHLIRTFAGDDTIYSGNNGGYSKIDGGLGSNTVVYAGKRANYTITAITGGFTVKDNVGGDGSDTLSNIQTLKFTDTTVDLTNFSTQ